MPDSKLCRADGGVIDSGVEMLLSSSLEGTVIVRVGVSRLDAKSTKSLGLLLVPGFEGVVTVSEVANSMVTRTLGGLPSASCYVKEKKFNEIASMRKKLHCKTF